MPYVGVFLIASFAWYSKKLTLFGTFAAMFVGISITWGLGWIGLLTLGLFFFSSSFLSSFNHHLKKEEINEKGSQRDAMQVFANGGVAAVMAILYGIVENPLLIVAFIASLAAANADTWASELGPLSKRKPLHIATFKRVDKGTSGAISLLGTCAALAGSFVIASLIGFVEISNQFIFFFIISVAGFLGNVIDTVIGAYGQVLYECKRCMLKTEKRIHCGKRTEHIRGFKWLNNDIVNVSCTASGAIIALLFGWLFV